MYIWQDYRKDLRFRLKGREETGSEADSSGQDSLVRNVNPYLRFSSIFPIPALDDSDGENNADADNILLHFLAQQDILQAVTAETQSFDLLFREIMMGVCGNEAQTLFRMLNEEDRCLFLTYLGKSLSSGGREDLFNEVFLSLFGRRQNERCPRSQWDGAYTPNSAEAYHVRSQNTDYYFCAAEETEYNAACFRLARLLFADVRRQIRPIWGKYCFGIIGASGSHTASVPRIGKTRIITLTELPSVNGG